MQEIRIHVFDKQQTKMWNSLLLIFISFFDFYWAKEQYSKYWLIMLSGKSYLAIQAASFAARSSTDRPPSAAKYFAAL